MNEQEKLTREKVNSVLDKFDNILGRIQELSENSQKVPQSLDERNISKDSNTDEESKERENKEENREKKSNLEIADSIISNSSNIFGSLSNIANQYTEGKRLDVEIQKLQNQLATIISNHKQEMAIIQSVFSERQMIFQKYFLIIDHGLATNNDGLLIATMESINNLAMKNPLEMINQKRNTNKLIDIDNDEPLQLNF